ncbi:MAG: transcription antitermination factor NusB [Clostridia bacterium]|nr:transcription antitermination factor NusB [Clostridia bacterium]MBR3976079.1 transcription antitermination factor NusB [Clostridia bacterium]
MKRSEAREQAFILSFERIFNMDTELPEMKEIASESELFELDAFAQTLAELVFDKAEELDGVISSFLKGWKIERLPKVVLAVLRLAVAEINYVEDTPDAVVVNEAVELTKKYALEEDASFVNGLLGSVVRSKAK